MKGGKESGVSNETILEAVNHQGKEISTLAKAVNKHGEQISALTKTVATQQGQIKLVLEAVISLQGEVREIKDDLRINYATKSDLADMKEELLAEIRPIGRAVDKDSITIIDHERRIHRLEKQMA